MDNRVICLMGPTATGKTDLACRLQDNYPVELVSVDSAMIYREMNIGTAKPTIAVLTQHPHALIDIVNPDETYSVGLFVRQATAQVDTILKRGNVPLLVGGTMLYFRALQQGLSTLPSADPTIRAQIDATVLTIGWAGLHEKLASIDPVSAAKIRPQDTQRIGRAWEVYLLTGEPLSTLQRASRTVKQFEWMNVILYPQSRTQLHEQIGIRFKNMLKTGLIEEVEALLARWPACKTMPSMRSVGYRQVLAYLEGQLDKTAFIEKGMIATRQLAKRQCTWLKSWPDPHYLDPFTQDPFEAMKELICLRKK